MIQEFRDKVIKAAQQLQQQLVDSAEQPALPSSSTDRADLQNDTAADEDPGLANLRERHRKRATEREAEEQRPLAKPKAAKRQNKRTAGAASGSVEPRASKRKNQRLTTESFTACARDPSELVDPGAASSGSAAQQRSRRVWELRQELKRLKDGWVVGDAAKEIQDLIERAKPLTKAVLTMRDAEHKMMKQLYTSRCGAYIYHGFRQDRAEVTTHASAELDARIHDFVLPMDEIDDTTQELYPCLWECKNRPHDAVLDSLLAMPMSPEQLMQTLKDTRGETGAPFGRLPTRKQLKEVTAMPPDLLVRRLVCLELPHVRFADLPDESRHAELIEKVVGHRRSVSDSRAAQPACITETDITKALHDFATDDFSNKVNKRWLHKVLNVQQRADADHLLNILETAVADFVQDLRANAVTALSLSASALASLALYRHILIIAKKKRCGPMILGPIIRLLADAGGESALVCNLLQYAGMRFAVSSRSSPHLFSGKYCFRSDSPPASAKSRMIGPRIIGPLRFFFALMRMWR